MTFRLRLVVEIQHRPEAFWLPLPAAPWPDFVPISRGCADDEIALVLFELAKYNQRGSPSPLTAQALAVAEGLVLPGGVEVRDDKQRILPSCCSGLECWVDWLYLLEDGTAPWMGHDPTPTVRLVDDSTGQVWPHEDLAGECVQFKANELADEVAQLQAQLKGFHERLDKFLLAHAPEEAAAVGAAFYKHFHVGVVAMSLQPK